MRARFENQAYGIKIKRVRGFREFVPMFHAHMEIVYVLSGEIRMTVDGKNYFLKAGQLGTVFPYQAHSFEDAPTAEVIIILFSPETAEGFGKGLFSVKPLSPQVEAGKEMGRLVERMAELSKPKNAIEEKTVRLYLGTLLGEILMTTGWQKQENGEWNTMKQILVYCAEAFREDITVRQTAKACFVSESYVTKIFTRKLQVPFRTYINHLRVAEAEHLLLDTDMKIINVMHSCGFKNQSSFNRVFLAETGETPMEFRKKYK